ncbi:MAG: thiamine-phosphate kinase [Deltaproteobacteria bacterium]|nr:thiamine-phosphate kinase [Deltaproteobacteria bacterium]MBN2671310.1 thiamine-phosphate kinase [Deltaproteobacteria bacterium]
MSRGESEFDLIRLLTTHQRASRSDVFLGVGDDAAVVEESDRYLLFTCDAQVERVHFLSDFSAKMLGKRLAAVNLSDIAAMGGLPMWALCSLFPGETTSEADLAKMYDGLYETFDRYGVQLIGGNIARSNNGLIADLFLVGEVPKKEVLLRSGAEPGDAVCVTGTLGDSAAGLSLLLSRSPQERDTQRVLVERHLLPSPRIGEGRVLASSRKVHACMDVSDGLLQDAGHLAKASGVQITIDDTALPVSDAHRYEATVSGTDAVLSALTGGEDYELLFTLSTSDVEEISNRIFGEFGTRVTVVGRVEKNTQTVGVSVSGTQYANLTHAGFDHLQSSDSNANGGGTGTKAGD